jgi:Ca2+-transporting ATPase
LVLFETGDIISADIRITEESHLEVDESALTGESETIRKTLSPLNEDTLLAERTNMLHKGTAVTRGSGKGVVVAVGMQSQLGKIASLSEAAQEEVSPLERRLERLGHRLVWITLIIAGFVAAAGWMAGKDLLLIIETAVALAVAAIPEGLPIVATIALARGMWRMAKRNTLINRLSAVETLGSTTIICTDKTGTLTENRMAVRTVALPSENGDRIQKTALEKSEEENGISSSAFREILEIGVLCNKASIEDKSPSAQEKVAGDPLEVALFHAAADEEIHRNRLLDAMPERREVPFDPEVRMMATFHESEGAYRVAVKGAPEAVLNACTKIRTSSSDDRILDQRLRKEWLRQNEKMAEEHGLRILAAATKNVDNEDADPYEDLTFLGLFGLMDPPRDGVKQAVSDCREAGIRVIMVTGDQSATAKSIGLSLGILKEPEAPGIHGRDLKEPDELSGEERTRLLETTIFSRVSPKQKLDLVGLHQKEGEVVGMTGDGVNDAPALKKADIGIAMGRRGTQVAREAADMVLKDDAFQSIVLAIQQGRAILENIRKFIIYLLSGNVSEIMIVAFALLAGAPLPLLPLQILYLNMIGDVFPALALGVGKGGRQKMKEPPRDPGESILTHGHWGYIGLSGLILAASVLGAFAIAFHWHDVDGKFPVTVSFLTLAFARLWHVFNMREPGSPVVSNEITKNPFIWGALILCCGLLLAAVYVPGLPVVLYMTSPGLRGWGLIGVMSLLPLVIIQCLYQTPVMARFFKRY